ncbi:hypothetical protein EHS13_28105 [Paenibacillus psychroresistens]|uniref:Glycosyltransferase RgtA/B/C/D-like domain-containing protein n=1 Tax=Paenibacillus psychroresistens TaxID=1778678 RepID=A0A6B8RR74_9BACL|nr:hypothetical protein [Paenibacillus psychroresistens]QGQ98469.1 hypothetical protein EHS13_28105 [Paenibacillus psychroresistens]
MIIILFLILIFTHERFIALLPFIVLLISFSKNLVKRKKIYFCSIPIIFVIFNIFIKDIVFQTGFMVGTGGTNITFSFYYIFIFTACGILNLLGLNVGPPYLNGEYIQNSKLYVQLFSFFISLITVGLIIFFIRNNKLDKRSNLMAVLTAIFLISLLLLPAVLTIRLELRWVYAPFIVLLLLFAYIFGRIEKKLSYLALILLTVFSLANNLYYKDYNNNSRVFFIRSQEAAEVVYDDTVKRYGENITDYKIYVIKNSDFEWILLGETFFKQFELKKKVTFNYVDNIQDIENSTEHAIIFRFNDDTKKVENISKLILKQEAIK